MPNLNPRNSVNQTPNQNFISERPSKPSSISKSKKLRISDLKNSLHIKLNLNSSKRANQLKSEKKNYKKLETHRLTPQALPNDHPKKNILSQIPFTTRSRLGTARKKKNFYKSGQKLAVNRKEKLFGEKFGKGGTVRGKLTKKKLSEIQGIEIKSVLRKKIAGSKTGIGEFDRGFGKERKFDKGRINILKMNSLRKKQKKNKISKFFWIKDFLNLLKVFLLS